MQTSSSVPLVSLFRMFDLIRESLAFLVWARRNNGLPASSQIVDHPCVNELLKRSPSSLWDLHWNSNTTSLWPTNVLTGDAMGEFMFRMFHNDKLFSPRLSWGTVTVTRPSPNGCKVNELWQVMSATRADTHTNELKNTKDRQSETTSESLKTSHKVLQS